MTARGFALAAGIAFLIAGLAGFVPLLVSPLHHGHPAVIAGGGQLFGLFPINALHNIVHALVGLWGIAAARSMRGAVLYARGIAILYFLLTLAGFVPGLETMFGLVPLYGNDIWLHGLLALAAAYFGWAHRNPRN